MGVDEPAKTRILAAIENTTRTVMFIGASPASLEPCAHDQCGANNQAHEKQTNARLTGSECGTLTSQRHSL